MTLFPDRFNLQSRLSFFLSPPPTNNKQQTVRQLARSARSDRGPHMANLCARINFNGFYRIDAAPELAGAAASKVHAPVLERV
jgi:hypothetical protein